MFVVGLAPTMAVKLEMKLVKAFSSSGIPPRLVQILHLVSFHHPQSKQPNSQYEENEHIARKILSILLDLIDPAEQRIDSEAPE